MFLFASWVGGGAGALAAEPRVDFENLAYFRDSSQQAQIDDIAALPESRWQPMAIPQFSFGFTADAVWVRIQLRSWLTPEQPHWMLAVTHPLFHSVDLYAQRPDARYQLIRGIPNEWSNVRMMAHRLPAFHIDSGMNGEVRTYWLRLRSDTSFAGAITLRHPLEFNNNRLREAFLWGCIFGAYALVAIFYSAFWVWTRERVHLYYALYVTANMIAGIFTGGWPHLVFPDVPVQWWTLVLGTSLSLVVTAAVYFSTAFVEMDKIYPRATHWINRSVLISASLFLVPMFLGYYVDFMPYLQSFTLLVMASLMVVNIRLAWRGHALARFYLFAFSFFYLGVVWRYLRNIGVLPANVISDNIYQAGAFVHMVIMSVKIFTRYRELDVQQRDTQSKLEAEVRNRKDQSDFIAMMSHEFRTPLSIISASIENLRLVWTGDDKSAARIDKIGRANDRMIKLIDDYMVNEKWLQEIDRARMRPASVQGLVREAIVEVQDAFDVAIECVSPIETRIQCSRELIQIALANLLANAARHSPANARVDVDILDSNGRVSLVVADRGSGIDAADHGRIFNRFYRGRSSNQKPGFGLGLHLVQKIAERHGGQIDYRPREGGGSLFTLHLPKVQ